MDTGRKKSLYYRQKILLSLLEVFGGRLKKTDLQKYLFLFTQEYQKNRSYEFVPYKFGCFSFQSVADLKKLTDIGIIKAGEDWEFADRNGYLAQIATEDREKLFSFRDKYSTTRGVYIYCSLGRQIMLQITYVPVCRQNDDHFTTRLSTLSSVLNLMYL